MTESSILKAIPPIATDDLPTRSELGVVFNEFGRHLDLLAEQLGASVLESDRQCVAVGDSFHELAVARNTINGVQCAEPEQKVIRTNCEQIGMALHGAVVALQYHDRLTQRLGLIRAGLNRLQSLLQDGSARSYEEWLQSLRDVEEVNVTEQHRLGPVADFGQRGKRRTVVAGGSVELF